MLNIILLITFLIFISAASYWDWQIKQCLKSRIGKELSDGERYIERRMKAIQIATTIVALCGIIKLLMSIPELITAWF